MSDARVVLLCPGQGAQAMGMGRSWVEAHPASAQTFAAADGAVEGDALGPAVGPALWAGGRAAQSSGSC